MYTKGEKRTGAFRERKKFDVTAFPEEGPALAELKETLEEEDGGGGGVSVAAEEPEEGEGVGKAELAEMEG